MFRRAALRPSATACPSRRIAACTARRAARRCPRACLGALAALAAAGAWADPAVAYPAGATVPESLLRFEIRWPTPLAAPLSIDQVALLDATGRVIPDALLDLPLPSADGRELTLLMHPGRVKTGVGANERLGRALKAGDVVTLVVSAPREPVVRRSWRVVAAQAEPVAPARWRYALPAAGSRLPLVVAPDVALGLQAESRIALRSPAGTRVAGRAVLDADSGAWTFLPAAPWQAGAYRLETRADLEDASGNRGCAPFEGPQASRARCDAGTSTPFEIGAAPDNRSLPANP